MIKIGDLVLIVGRRDSKKYGAGPFTVLSRKKGELTGGSYSAYGEATVHYRRFPSKMVLDNGSEIETKFLRKVI